MMEQKTIISLILAVLVVISVVQAIQLNTLKEKVSTGTLKVASGTSVPLATDGKKVAPVPSSVKELPSMVGGC